MCEFERITPAYLSEVPLKHLHRRMPKSRQNEFRRPFYRQRMLLRNSWADDPRYKIKSVRRWIFLLTHIFLGVIRPVALLHDAAFLATVRVRDPMAVFCTVPVMMHM